MRTKLLCILLLLTALKLNAQTQIGQDINGEATSNGFGLSVSINDSGNRIAAGTPFNSGNGNSAGHIRMYQLNASNQWLQMGQDIDGASANDQMGRSVSLNGVGNRVATGSQYNDTNGNNSGNTQVFEFNTSNQWVQIGQDINGEAAGDFSGLSVRLNSVGDRVIIGAYGNDENGPSSGHARVYQLYNNNQWLKIGQDLDGDAAYDNFGGEVDINGLGDRIIIASWQNDTNGNNAGLVRVYQLNSSNQWSQLGQDLFGTNAEDNFGRSVCMNSAGNRIIVGAIGSDNGGTNSGQSYVYELNVNSQWIQIGQGINGEASGDKSGFSTSINALGDIISIGSFYNSGSAFQAGHVRTYKLNTNSNWVQLGDDIDGEAADDQSSFSICLNANGQNIITGAMGNDGNGNSSGYVRVFDVNPSTLSLIQKLGNLNNIKMHPNPTTTVLNIKMNSNLKQATVYSVLGAKVLETKSNTINTSNLKTGLYLITIEAVNGSIATKRFIKQ
ncbi:T9SS type A sorting domain-containing protein [Lacinutrix sp. MEBiC02404]